MHGGYKRFFSSPESSDPFGGVRASCLQAMGDHFPELKRSVREANHPPASANVKNEWSCISTSLRGMHRDIFERYFQVDGLAANETVILLNIQPYFVVKTYQRCVKEKS